MTTMDAEQTRDALVEALRRDLAGPLADASGHYPGSAPVDIVRGQSFAKPADANAVLVAPDGGEVLLEPPTARYIVGALYPSLDPGEEHELDDAQAPHLDTTDDTTGTGVDTGAEAGPAGWELGTFGSPTINAIVVEPALGALKPPPSAAVPGSDAEESASLADEVADVPRASADRPGRPSSFGMSFMLPDDVDDVTVSVSGAWYELFAVSVGSRERDGWHRMVVEDQVSFHLAPGGSRHRETVQAGPLTLEVGLHARAAVDGARIITCYLVNRTAPGSTLAQRVLFSAQLQTRLPAGSLLDYPDKDPDTSAEAATLRLLYAEQPVRAVGHGVDAVAVTTTDADTVTTDSFPVAKVTATTADIDGPNGPLVVTMADLSEMTSAATATVEQMLTGYRTWIAARTEAAAQLTGAAADTAREHLISCAAFADDMESGWVRVLHDDDTNRCFRWMSAAMGKQRRSYAADTRKLTTNPKTGEVLSVAGPDPQQAGREPTWRPFQLAFVLANLSSVSVDGHPRRGVVDVIWMPTGGGKTEAYLALAAFTMLHRRLTRVRDGLPSGGTTVLMRYTLRLLTAQQLQRAASLICALEQLRSLNKDVLGRERFSIGAWLGSASTPNWRKDALSTLRKYARGVRGVSRPFLLSRCPSCAAEMGETSAQKVLGYSEQALPGGRSRMIASCPNPTCPFHLSKNPAGLPVYEVDEDIYDRPPTFLVATVDKFAQLAWNERARTLFGLDAYGQRKNPPPELIIQDELHLIAGPLGSLVGLYESALAQLCVHDGGRGPHVVAATATTRAYARQAGALYACDPDQVRLVPPPGLSAADSYFATDDESSPARSFVAVCATGAGLFAHAQMRVMASLAHAASALEQSGGDIDPYWTNVVFFGSLRDLGQAKALISTDLRGYAWRLVRATGIRSGTARAGKPRAAIRNLTDVELTSASSSDATAALERLARRRGEPGVVDLALATSVIEVGVDVERLGLLTIIRQPKTTAQYIQVSGRVGRSPRQGPGLVVTVLNPLSGRDISHYERFSSVHERLYAAVEPASVTPFTDAALTRGLRGTVAAVVRQLRRGGGGAVDPDDEQLVGDAAEQVAVRAGQVGDDRTAGRVRDVTAGLLGELRAALAQALPWGTAAGSGVQFLRPLEDPAPEDRASWAVLTSLRSVDADAALRIDDDWLPAPTRRQPAAATAGRPDETEESW